MSDKPSFSINKIHRNFKKGRYAKNISKTASVYMAAVLEYLSAEVLDLAKENAENRRGKKILPRDVMLAIKQDIELSEVCREVTMPSVGVPVNILPELLPKRSKKVEQSISQEIKKERDENENRSNQCDDDIQKITD